MKKTLLTLSVLSLFLSACGGSSGGNSSKSIDTSSSQKPIVKPIEKPVVKPETKPDSSSEVSQSGIVQSNLSQNLSTLNVDGKELVVEVPGISSKGWAEIKGNVSINGQKSDLTTSGSAYAYTKFGRVKDLDTNKEYVFAQGKADQATKDMPTTGTAKFEGDALQLANGESMKGLATLNADFGAKKLSGQLSGDNGFKTINIQADIKGNSFNGTNNDIKTNGAFFGAGAKELTGTYEGKSVTGAFGAKQK